MKTRLIIWAKQIHVCLLINVYFCQSQSLWISLNTAVLQILCYSKTLVICQMRNSSLIGDRVRMMHKCTYLLEIKQWIHVLWKVLPTWRQEVGRIWIVGCCHKRVQWMVGPYADHATTTGDRCSFIVTTQAKQRPATPAILPDTTCLSQCNHHYIATTHSLFGKSSQ